MSHSWRRQVGEDLRGSRPAGGTVDQRFSLARLPRAAPLRERQSSETRLEEDHAADCGGCPDRPSSDLRSRSVTMVDMSAGGAELSDRQYKVLEWIASGCPEGVWPDFTYKTTTYALAARNLVKVDRRRGSWSATVTEDGTYYLEHRTFPEKPSLSKRSGSTPGNQARKRTTFEISADDLIAEVQAANGTLVISDPTSQIRAAYRRAISKAISDGLVPEGLALRHKGRDAGHLEIKLITRPEVIEVAAAPPPVPVPAVLEEIHDAVRMFRDGKTAPLDVSEELRPRTLLILQAIADECGSRGHEFTVWADHASGFCITVKGVSSRFVVYEEMVRRAVPIEEDLVAAKYEWQRVRATVEKVRSGKLAIRTGTNYRPEVWADRRRWALESRLPQVFAHAEREASIVIERDARLERERVDHLRKWNQAKVVARQRYVEDLNRRRLDEQLAQSQRTEKLRQYAAAVEQRAAAMDNPDETDRAKKWAAYARSEADRLDPLLQPRSLRFEEPVEVSDAALDPFMPRGMSARQPPT